MSNSIGNLDSRSLTRTIESIRGHKFTIPNYQRGYRWKKHHVQDLLQDIWTFQTHTLDTRQFYCLQPIVVKRGGDETWEVIDGQQRLTTIYLILRHIDSSKKEPRPLFSIDYQTRERSKDFLETLDPERKDEYSDFFHMYQAAEAIKTWFHDRAQEHDKEQTNLEWDLRGAIMSRVTIIWYEVDKEQAAEKVFTRLNTGKIPLTDAELIKALILNSANFAPKDNQTPGQDNINPPHPQVEPNLTQFEIASEWDRIEYDLQDDNLWGFLAQDLEQKNNRIGYLFEIAPLDGKNESQSKYIDYPLFNKYNDYFSSKDREVFDIAQEWRKIKDTYMLIREWYDDPYFYHYIGYHLHAQVHPPFPGLDKLIRKYGSIDKSNFKTDLKKGIKERVFGDISDITEYNFNDTKTKVQNVLLLFNIEETLSLFKTDGDELTAERFSFRQYSQKKWSLEHIRARREDLDSFFAKRKNRDRWREDHLDSFRRHYPNANNLKDLEKIDFNIDVERERFVDIILETYKESGIEDVDGIGNLALLDVQTNSSLSNGVFDVKRTKIIEQQGYYIPLATKRVFLKYYSLEGGSLFLWNTLDAENYLQAIRNRLKYYLPKNKVC